MRLIRESLANSEPVGGEKRGSNGQEEMTSRALAGAARRVDGRLPQEELEQVLPWGIQPVRRGRRVR